MRCFHIHNAHGFSRCSEPAYGNTKFCRDHQKDVHAPEYTDKEVLLIQRVINSTVRECLWRLQYGPSVEQLLDEQYT